MVAINSFIKRYMIDRWDFPQNLSEDILPVGTYWEYVPSDFLDAFINYVEIKSAWLIVTYDLLWEVSVIEPVGSSKWVKKKLNIRDRFNLLTEKGRIVHSVLSGFNDCIFIFAKSKDNGLYYYLFNYDPDVSDCAIGRFTSNLSEKEVLADFDNCCKSLEDGNNLQIPLDYFQGWVHW